MAIDVGSVVYIRYANRFGIVLDVRNNFTFPYRVGLITTPVYCIGEYSISELEYIGKSNLIKMLWHI